MPKSRPAGSNVVENFQEMVSALTPMEAFTEANRCLFCQDAPCTAACPTSVDVPMFIRKISTGNLKGSAKTIMDANPLGASCARICPTEELCVGACVLNELDAPIMIGKLQRYATDYLVQHNIQLYQAGSANQHKIAIVGAGPAGLSAARELALLGYEVTLLDAHEKGGGLNSYAVAPFRLPQAIPLWEVNQILELGVQLKNGVTVGRDITVEELTENYDAVLVAVGMGKIQSLEIPGENLEGVYDALDLIEQTKDGDPTQVHLGAKVVVIGAGNTAIDAATTAKRLGAETVQILYRRTEHEMTAYPFEYDFAKQDGVEFRWLTAPTRVLGTHHVEAVECVRMELGEPDERGRRRPQPVPGSEFTVEVDNVIFAVGQQRRTDVFDDFRLKHSRGVVEVDESFQTSRPGVFAAGDCTFAGGGRNEATVVLAVQQGKQAAAAIHRQVSEKYAAIQGVSKEG